MALFRPFSPLLPPFPRLFPNLSDSPIGQGAGIVWGRGFRESVIRKIFFVTGRNTHVVLTQRTRERHDKGGHA